MLNTPESVLAAFRESRLYKSSLGRKGMFEQNRVNERFFLGDQWHGAFCGTEKPLVRHNVIKRIGDYKMGTLMQNRVEIRFAAEGIAKSRRSITTVEKMKDSVLNGNALPEPLDKEDSVNFFTESLSRYFAVCGGRIRLSEKLAQILHDSFITGTGILYTYWNEKENDLSCEVLSCENVCFGDNTAESVEEQPFLIIESYKPVSAVLLAARKHGGNTAAVLSGISREDKEHDRKIPVYHKFYKVTDENDEIVMATVVTEKAVVCPPYSTGLTRYPFAVFAWEKRKNRMFGESEVTFLVPNQIAINRLLTVSAWSAMSMGMPIMTVNGDTVSGEITNDPGQIIKVYGTNEDVAGAVHFVTPPDFSRNFNESVEELISGTLEGSGAGEVIPDQIGYNNTAAIQSVRAVAGIGLISLKERYLRFNEDVALIFADFWQHKYGRRSLCIEEDGLTWYLPFNGKQLDEIRLAVSAAYAAQDEEEKE